MCVKKLINLLQILNAYEAIKKGITFAKVWKDSKAFLAQTVSDYLNKEKLKLEVKVFTKHN